MFLSLTIAAIAGTPAHGMRVETAGDQLILSGPVVGDEPAMVARALAETPAVTTIILRNSGGGDAPAGYRVGEMIRAKGLRTAVSGFCYSSCSRMFLGGTIRLFTDDYPPEITNVGFHGHYRNDGLLDADLVRRLGLKDWIVKYSDGKADPALVERWINIPVGRGMMRFYHPALSRGHAASTFFCLGNEPTRDVFACEAEPRSALDLGVITSLDIITSNDRTTRATAPRP